MEPLCDRPDDIGSCRLRRNRQHRAPRFSGAATSAVNGLVAASAPAQARHPAPRWEGGAGSAFSGVSSYTSSPSGSPMPPYSPYSPASTPPPLSGCMPSGATGTGSIPGTPPGSGSLLSCLRLPVLCACRLRWLCWADLRPDLVPRRLSGFAASPWNTGNSYSSNCMFVVL